MPIDTGRYCSHCTTESGALQSFEDRFEKMIGWQMRQKPGLTRPEAEAQTLAFMARLPAWKNHPRVRGGEP
jgi:hypothetical protein